MGERANYLSRSLLISYLSILAVPLLAIVIIYFTASDLLLSIQKEKAYSTLNTAALEIDRHLEEAASLGLFVSKQDKMIEICRETKESGGKNDFYKMFLLSRSISDYTIFNAALGDVYIFFHKKNYMIKAPAVVPADERSYQAMGSLTEDSYEELLGLLNSKYYEKQVVSLENGNLLDKQLAVMQSFPHGTYGVPQGTVVVLLDDQYLLQGNLIQEEGITLMLDGQGEIQKAIKGTSCELAIENIPLQDISKEPYSTLRINSKKYVVCSVITSKHNYRYLTLVPQKVLLDKIGYIKYVIVLLCFASAGVGIATCLVLWRKRKTVVLAYCDYQNEFGKASGEGKHKGFWDGIEYVLDSMVQLQATLKLQGNFMKTAVIRKILLGEYAEEKTLTADLEHADIELEGDGYYGVALSFKRMSHDIGLENWNEFLLFIREYVEEHITIPHHYCEMDPFMIALILPVKMNGLKDTIKNIFSKFEEDFISRRQIQVYIGIGTEVKCRLDISNSFEEAVSVTKYLKFHDIRMVMTKEELPKQTQTFFFPMETEIHLVKTIKQGNLEDLEDLYRVILFENFNHRQLSLTMITHLTELIRYTAIRALREVDQDCKKNIDSISYAENIEDIYLELKKVVPDICKERKRLEGEKEDGEKKRLEQWIGERYSKEDLCLVQVAQEFGVTENKIYKDFKNLFHVSFSEYLEDIRIKKACDLLKDGVSVKEVALQVGYSSDLSFRRAFKRVMGLAPSYYSKGLERE